MEEWNYLNNELEINIGDVFYHKADGRKMVVIAFSRDLSRGKTNLLDKYHAQCRFYDDQNNKYNDQWFIFPELSKTKVGFE